MENERFHPFVVIDKRKAKEMKRGWSIAFDIRGEINLEILETGLDEIVETLEICIHDFWISCRILELHLS